VLEKRTMQNVSTHAQRGTFLKNTSLVELKIQTTHKMCMYINGMDVDQS
jgi:hypothetical protein